MMGLSTIQYALHFFQMTDKTQKQSVKVGRADIRTFRSCTSDARNSRSLLAVYDYGPRKKHHDTLQYLYNTTVEHSV